METTLAEISRYYLLGWYINPDSLKPGKYSRIQVAVKGRSDLKVRLRQGLVDLSVLVFRQQDKADNANPATGTGSELLQALEGPFPLNDLPVSLYAGYVYQPDKGYVLAISYQVDVGALDAGARKDKERIRIDIMGAVGDKNGRSVGNFSENLSLSTDPADQSKLKQKGFAHRQMSPLEPGVYQVRVAARDPRSGLIGCVWEWIDIPRYTAGKISMSSIFLKEQTDKDVAPDLTPGTLSQIQFSIQRRFSASAKVSFFLDIYNTAGADIQVESKIYRGNQIAVQSSPKPVQISRGGDNAGRISYGDILTIAGLPPGSYTLEVSAIDRKVYASATQRVSFWIE